MTEFKVSYYRSTKGKPTIYASEVITAKGIVHAFTLAKAHAKAIELDISSVKEVVPE